MSDIVVGRFFGSDTVATKTDTGDWQVIVTMLERRKVEGGEWEEKKLQAMCTENDFIKAYSVAMNSAIGQFNDRLTVTGTSSLFEALEGEEITGAV